MTIELHRDEISNEHKRVFAMKGFQDYETWEGRVVETGETVQVVLERVKKGKSHWTNMRVRICDIVGARWPTNEEIDEIALLLEFKPVHVSETRSAKFMSRNFFQTSNLMVEPSRALWEAIEVPRKDDEPAALPEEEVWRTAIPADIGVGNRRCRARDCEDRDWIYGTLAGFTWAIEYRYHVQLKEHAIYMRLCEVSCNEDPTAK